MPNNKRHRILTLSESENNTADLSNLNPKKLFWRKKENLNPIIQFNNSASRIKANINEHSSILNIFKIFLFNSKKGQCSFPYK